MTGKLIGNTFWAMRYVILSLLVIVWGMTINNWAVSNFVGMGGIFIFVGGWVVFILEEKENDF